MHPRCTAAVVYSHIGLQKSYQETLTYPHRLTWSDVAHHRMTLLPRHQPCHVQRTRPQTRSLTALPVLRPTRRCRAAVATSPVSIVDEGASAQFVPADLQEALQLSQAFNKAFSTSLYHEHGPYQIKEVEGEIPAGLKGTLLRNGPGLFEVGGKALAHPFDGDGMVCSLSFDGEGRAFFCNKYVRTPGFLAERRTGEQQYRSAFNRGVPKSAGLTFDLPFLGAVRLVNPFDLQVKDAANTNVLRWGGKTLALYERGPPHQLTPHLDTLGPDTLNDTMVGKYMAAHLRVTQEEDGPQRVVMFAAGEKGLDADMCFYEYDQDFNMLHRTQAVLPGAAFGFFHDMAVSQHFYVLVENPVRMDVVKLLTDVPAGRASIAECLMFQDSQPARLHLIPRPGRGAPDGGVRTYEIPGASTFTFHHGNAWELESDGATPTPLGGQIGRYLVLDSCSSRSVDFSNTVESVGSSYYGNPLARVEPSRIVVDLKADVHPSAVTRSIMAMRSSEFPSVAPSRVSRAHTHTYMVASPVLDGPFFGPNQAIVKMSTDPSNGVKQPFDRSAVQEDMWLPNSCYQFPGEPVFVPRGAGGAEDDGWVMCWMYDSERNRSALVILDAQHLSQGPLATLHLDDHHIPAGLHGMWTSDYLGPAPGTPDAAAYDIRHGV